MELILLEDVKDGFVKGFQPYQIFSIVVENQEVGRLVLREGTDEERYYDGHIGYTIDEEYRGHSYSYQACLLLKEKTTRDHFIITCDPDNKASRRIIEKLGCHYIETKPIPQRLRKFFHSSEKEKMIFRFDMEV